MIFSNEYLIEATFLGNDHLQKHYSQHVLQGDEEFTNDDPKFPPMSKDEYAKKAEELTLQPARKVDSVQDIYSSGGIVGWVANDPTWRHPRNIKVRLDSPLHPGYEEFVSYVDDEKSGNQVLTYMLSRKGKARREFQRKIDELPENKEKVNEDMENEKITSEDIENFIEDIYDLRKSSIASEGEYGLGNLVFKEFRNLGYLDNLKDLKNQIKSRELSLEGFNEGENTNNIYIEGVAGTYNEAHTRYLNGDMNSIYRECEETSKYRVLNEKNLNRISKGHEKDGYAILSASRGECSDEENNKRTKELKDKLKSKGYSYLAVYGGYKELENEASLEKSFVVYPYDIIKGEKKDFNTFKKDIEELASNYNQDTILICEPNGVPKYVAINPEADEFEFGGDTTYNDTKQTFFTAIKKWNDSSLNRKNKEWTSGKPQRYTLNPKD